MTRRIYSLGSGLFRVCTLQALQARPAVFRKPSVAAVDAVALPCVAWRRFRAQGVGGRGDCGGALNAPAGDRLRHEKPHARAAKSQGGQTC